MAGAGANWRFPEGRADVFPARGDHPVVQVSHNDAVAYCNWLGKRLPTEVEWEFAAKGGTNFEHYPWGEDLLGEGAHQCNIWQGDFPYDNLGADGYLNTAPSKCYQPNGYGLYQVIGNVWEWCANPGKIPLERFKQQSAEAFWRDCQAVDDRDYAIRGGSFLCHASYCNSNRAMSTASNIGFRCVDL